MKLDYSDLLPFGSLPVVEWRPLLNIPGGLWGQLWVRGNLLCRFLWLRQKAVNVSTTGFRLDNRGRRRKKFWNHCFSQWHRQMWGSHYGTLQRWAPLICGAVHLYKLYKSWNDLRREFKKEREKKFLQRETNIYRPLGLILLKLNTFKYLYFTLMMWKPTVCVLLVMKAVNQDVFI